MFETSDMCFVMPQTGRLERICGYMKKLPYRAVPDYNSSKWKGLLVVIRAIYTGKNMTRTKRLNGIVQN